MLGSTLLLMVGSHRKQAFLLLHHDDVCIFIHQFKHLMLEFVVVFGFAYLNLHAWLQREIVLGGNNIIHQYHTVSQ